MHVILALAIGLATLDTYLGGGKDRGTGKPPSGGPYR